MFSPSAIIPGATNLPGAISPSELFTTEPQVIDIPTGVDTRISDCVVCFPAESGLAPRYFSFENAKSGSGVAVGQGQPASADWWTQATQEQGAAIPEQITEQFRSREFKSIDSFDRATWRAIAENSTLSEPFDEINRKRMARGFAPYAPKSSWVGERREFEIRVREVANDSAVWFDLDQLSITEPNSNHGVLRVTPTYLPWPVSSGTRTWTPLIPPGSELLGPTELPMAPEQPTLCPGEATDPVGSQSEALPAVDPADVNASILGFGEDDDLPSPDLVFAGPPVEPLEVGPYNELSGRSRLDGLDIDHIASRQALKRYVLTKDPRMTTREVYDLLRKAPSIAIPTSVHQKFSATYGGRNTQAKQTEDALDLRAAVDRNLNAIKPGLLEAGFVDSDIEAARLKLHELNVKQGWYR